MENDVMDVENVFAKLNELLKEKKYGELKRELSDMYEQDIAEFFEEIKDDEDMVKVFRLLPKGAAADVFSYISPDIQEEIIRKLSDAEVHNIIEDLSLDDAADLLEEMPANVVKRVLANSNPDTRAAINKLLQYEDDTAGTIMTTEYIDLKTEMTVETAIARIRKLAKDTEQINTFYVTDSARVLKGVVSIKDIILAKPEARIGDIMEEDVIYGETFTDQETLAHLFKKYDVLTMPIVDKEKRLVGIVTVDDIIDIINKEASEDIAKMAAIVPTEKPYLKTSVWRIWASRIPWLLLLMVSATFTGLILNHYEAMLPTVLVACVPMLMDTAGNAGGQSSVTIIRGIALNEIEFKDIFKVIWKELRVGLICAVCLGAACFLKLQLIDRLIFGYDYTVIRSLVVAFALAITVVMAKFIGCMLPLFAKLIKLDPAVVASPFITTIVDALSLLVFCTLAGALL